MSNFAFLKPYGRNLASAGLWAEQHLFSTPHWTAIEARWIGEVLAKIVVKDRRLKIVRQPSKSFWKAGFEEHLQTIKSAKVAPKSIVSDWERLKQIGNIAVHEHSTSIDDASDSLECLYRVAVWFVRVIKHSTAEIPPFKMPERPEPSLLAPVADWLNASRNGRYCLIVLGALGATWGWQVYRDQGHRPDVALVKTIRIVFLVLVLLLLAIPAFVFAHGMTIWSLYNYLFNSIADKVGINLYLVRVIAVAALLPFLYAVRLFASPRHPEMRRRGTLLLVSLVVLSNLGLYFATRNSVFRPEDGAVMKYYVRTDHGIVLFDRPGFDPETGQRLLPVSSDIEREIRIQIDLRGAPLQKVDASNATWFNPYTGKPMLWFYRNEDGILEFYNQPGMHPKTGDPLQPVSKAIYLEWHKSVSVAAPGLRAKVPLKVGGGQALGFRTDLGRASTTPGQPGVVVLHLGSGERNGADAVGRHIQGTKSATLNSVALDRRGLGPRLFEGDSALIREAISKNHLSSLTVADVKLECRKRSSLDSELLSCDLTTNARKYDQRGTPAGSVQTHSIGAGFSEADAIDSAAVTASNELASFASR